MTYEEYIKQVQTALKKLDKTDKDAVHQFNEWRAQLYSQVKSKG